MTPLQFNSVRLAEMSAQFFSEFQSSPELNEILRPKSKCQVRQRFLSGQLFDVAQYEHDPVLVLQLFHKRGDNGVYFGLGVELFDWGSIPQVRAA